MTDTDIMMTKQEIKEEIHNAVMFIADNCDGAESQDGVGFNGSDTKFGNRAVEMEPEEWSDAMCWEAYQMLAKYSNQLAKDGLDYSALPVPERVGGDGRDDARQASFERKTLKVGDDEFVLKFKYEAGLIRRVKKLKGQWKQNSKTWTFPIHEDVGGELRSLAFDYGFIVTDEAQELLDRFKDVEVEERPEGLRSLTLRDESFILDFEYDADLVYAVKSLTGRKWDSKEKVWVVPKVACDQVMMLATTWGFEHDGNVFSEALRMSDEARMREEASSAETSKLKIEGLGAIHPKTGEKLELRPFQVAGVAYAIDVKKCFIADEMGLGKTVQSLAAVHMEKAFPLLVVCPATLKSNWEREVRMWLPEKTVHIVDNKVGVKNSDVVIINYDILDKQQEELMKVGFQALVFDESHYAKNSTAKRTKALKKIAKAIPENGMVLALTGTPVLNRPVELVSQLEILGRIEDFGGSWNFRKRYCDAKHDGFGWNFGGASNTSELNNMLRQTCYVRRQKEDVLKELPTKARYTIETQLSRVSAKEYKAVENETIVWLAEEGRYSSMVDTLAKLMVLKRIAGEGKVEAACEWIDTFLDSTDRKLVVFGHHKSVVNALAEKYGGLRVSGSDSMKARQASIDLFQNDPNSRVIVLNTKAGGVGITLTAASDVLFVEQGWTPAEHDQAEDRCHRIGQDAESVSAFYLLAEETIDDDIYELIAKKRLVVDAVTDGEAEMAESVMNELIGKLVKRAND
tara:strand:+ start:19300 stop:21528 length:2229 start_codon:yes stop_codon:yes gene_type:complete